MWTGRELYRYQNDNFRNTYYYDSEGLRSRKNIYIKNANGGFDYNGKVMYQYLGGLLTYQCTYNASDEVDKEMYFFYDSYDRLTAIRYISSIGDYYYYVTTNKQGDVLGLYSANGNLKVSYEYDAWGNCTVKDASGNAITSTVHIGNVNPIRYRSYYYDTDTGMYYLQSRYYDATIGRFINADGYVGTSTTKALSYNMFAYCLNNPIVFADSTGHFPWLAVVVGVFAIAAIGIAHYVSKNHPDGYLYDNVYNKKIGDCNLRVDLVTSDSSGPGIDWNEASAGETDSSLVSLSAKDEAETGMLKIDVLSIDAAATVDYSYNFGVDVGLNASILSFHIEQSIDLGIATVTPSYSGYVGTIGGSISWDVEEGKFKTTAPAAGPYTGGFGFDVDFK